MATDPKNATQAEPDNKSNAPIQGIDVPSVVQSGEGTTAAEVGTDQPGVKNAKKSGGVSVRVKTPMTVNLTDDEAKKAGDAKVTSYSLGAGLNENVPSVVADHWFVKGNLVED